MRKRIGILMFLMMGMLMMSSASMKMDKGIAFQDVSFEEAKTLALKSGKLIFIDCYTDWCGPCKRMAETSFKDERVGKFFNEHFINVKIEMEKNPIGPELARLYKVRAYPTLLFVDGNGKLVKDMIGMQSADGLLLMARSVTAK